MGNGVTHQRKPTTTNEETFPEEAPISYNAVTESTSRQGELKNLEIEESSSNIDLNPCNNINNQSPSLTSCGAYGDEKKAQQRKKLETIYVQSSEFPYTRPKTINPVYRNKALEQVRSCHENSGYETNHDASIKRKKNKCFPKETTLVRANNVSQCPGKQRNKVRRINVLSLDDDGKAASDGCISYTIHSSSYPVENYKANNTSYSSISPVPSKGSTDLHSKLVNVVPEKRKHYFTPTGGLVEREARMERQKVYRRVLETVSKHMAQNLN